MSRPPPTSWLIQGIFGRLQNKTIRGLNAVYDASGRPRSAYRIVTTTAAFAGSVYCAGALFQHYFFSYGLAQGPSMYPTMPSETHLIIIDRRYRMGRGIKVGDVINFTPPIFKDQYAGKRVVGLPGDYVVRDRPDQPSVGGAAVPGIIDWLSESERKRGLELKGREEPEMIQVPEGHVWVTGDNFSWSRDSRFYGAVPMALIRGKLVASTAGIFKSWNWTTGDQLRKVTSSSSGSD